MLDKEIEYQVNKGGRNIKKRVRFSSKFYRESGDFIEIGVPKGEFLRRIRIPRGDIFQITDVFRGKKGRKYINKLTAY